LLFPKYKIYFTPNSLIFQDEEKNEQHLIDQENFEEF